MQAGGYRAPKKSTLHEIRKLVGWSCTLDIYLVDGTHELFRHYYALPSARDSDGREVAAVRGVQAAASAVAAATDTCVDRVIVCTTDKDLAQCMCGSRIVQLNRRTRVTFDEAAIVRKFRVSPASIPDYLALVGYPGLPGWGAKSSAAALAKCLHLESIPKDCLEWRVNATNGGALVVTP
jgi:5'-3' exonuclease